VTSQNQKREKRSEVPVAQLKYHPDQVKDHSNPWLQVVRERKLLAPTSTAATSTAERLPRRKLAPELLLRIAGQQLGGQQRKEYERRSQELTPLQQRQGVTRPAVDADALSRNVWFQSWAQKQRAGQQEGGGQQQGGGQDRGRQQQEHSNQHLEEQGRQQQEQTKLKKGGHERQQQDQKEQQGGHYRDRQQQHHEEQGLQQQEQPKQHQGGRERQQQEQDQNEKRQSQKDQRQNQWSEDQPKIELEHGNTDRRDHEDIDRRDHEEGLQHAGHEAVGQDGGEERNWQEQESRRQDVGTGSNDDGRMEEYSPPKDNKAQEKENTKEPVEQLAVLRQPLTNERGRNISASSRGRTYFPVGGGNPALVIHQQTIKDDNIWENVAASERFAPDESVLHQAKKLQPASLDFSVWRTETVLSDEKSMAPAASSVSLSDAFYVDHDWRLLAPTPNTQHSVAQGTMEESPHSSRARGGGNTDYTKKL